MIAADRALSAQAIETGLVSRPLWTAARWLTELGGAPVLWIVTLTAAALLWRRLSPRHAGLLLATAITGRISVELLKTANARPRPDLVEHPVFTHSLAMPSGHAANSMIVYLTIALLAPERHRRASVAVAVLLSISIGLTRPILGVHWPSDVVAGWLWGAGWTLLCVGLGRAWTENNTTLSPSGERDRREAPGRGGRPADTAIPSPRSPAASRPLP